MDRFNLAQTVASDRKKQIDHDLKVSHMLKEKNWKKFEITKTRRMVLRFAPVVFIASVLVLLTLI